MNLKKEEAPHETGPSWSGNIRQDHLLSVAGSGHRLFVSCLPVLASDTRLAKELIDPYLFCGGASSKVEDIQTIT